MREIVSPLSGIRSPFGARRNPLAAYRAGGFTPKLVAQFADDFYAKEGRKSTFDGVLEPTATTNATMVDSDGLLKWRPHNLLTYSEDLTQSWTTTGTPTIDDASTVSLSGTDAITSAFANTSVGGGYTIEAELWTETDVGGQVDIGFNTNNLSNTFSAPITLSATPTKYLFSKSTNTATQNGFRLRNVGGTAKTVKISKVRLYRSDLGGMVDNPDTGDSYVPTTTSAVYLPRRGHHIYNGSAWVNEGVLIDPETRTNLLLNSGSLSTQSVTVSANPHTLHFTGTGSITLSGAHSATLSGTGAGEENRVSLTFTPSAGTLVVTVSGTVTNGQLEEGSTPSSYIPTSGSQVARAGEQLVIPHENISWPEPKVIGPELVTNGTFDTDLTGWSASGNWAWSNSGAQHTSSGSGENLGQNVFEAGKVYQVQWAQDGDYVAVYGDGLSTLLSNTNGTTDKSIIFVSASGGSLTFRASSGTITIDNISVKEIEPLALSIHMQGRMTYADTGIINEAVFVRWAADSSNGIVLGIDTDGADTGQFKAYQAALGVADRVETVGDYFSPGINVPFNIASRHGSTFVNGAVDGVALTENTTPTALPDLETTDLQLAYSGGSMVIKQFAMWDVDIGDTGLEDATS